MFVLPQLGFALAGGAEYTFLGHMQTYPSWPDDVDPVEAGAQLVEVRSRTMVKPTRVEMIKHAIELLEAGELPGKLPVELMAEFDLTPAQARDIAQAAFLKWKRREGDD